MITSTDVFNIGQSWPPESERGRLRKWKQNKLLYDRKHEHVFPLLRDMLNQPQYKRYVLAFDFPHLLSNRFADLLLGEPMRITAGKTDSNEQNLLENLLELNDFNAVSREVAIDVSRYGVGFYKIRGENGAGIIEAVDPMTVFPIVNPANVRDVQAYAIAYTYSRKAPTLFDRDKKDYFLSVELLEKGKITSRLYQLGNGGERIAKLLQSTETKTGLNDFLLQPVFASRTSGEYYGDDDYSAIDSTLQELESRFSRIAHILDKHSDPNMIGSSNLLQQEESGEYTFTAGGKFLPVDNEDIVPQYVTWDGQLAACFQEIDLLMDQLYMQSETSAAMFGQFKQGLVESGSALRRLMTSPLIKTRRLSESFAPAIKRTLTLAAALQGEKCGKIDIQFKDGLPVDEREQAEIMATRVQNKLISRAQALRQIYGYDDAALQEELAAIAADESIANAKQTISTPALDNVPNV